MSSAFNLRNNLLVDGLNAKQSGEQKQHIQPRIKGFMIMAAESEIEGKPGSRPISKANDVAAIPDGMTRASRLLARTRPAPMEDTLGFALVEIAEGRAVLSGTPGPNVLNPMGIAHGGYAAALMDSACGIAVLTTLDDGQRFSTLELKVAYHKAIDTQTGPIRAEGSVLTRGRRIAYSEARLLDASGTLLASATSTLMVL